MQIRFYNARILTMASGNKIDKGEVWTKDDKIVFVGNTDNISKTAEMTNMVTDRWDREID